MEWSLLGKAMTCLNSFGLVTGTFLLGFDGSSKIPKNIYRYVDWSMHVIFTWDYKLLTTNFIKLFEET